MMASSALAMASRLASLERWHVPFLLDHQHRPVQGPVGAVTRGRVAPHERRTVRRLGLGMQLMYRGLPGGDRRKRRLTRRMLRSLLPALEPRRNDGDHHFLFQPPADPRADNDVGA